MGDLIGGMSPNQIDVQRGEGEKEEEFDTGIEGIKADGQKDGVPIFNVSKEEFYQNMNYGRKRLRFKPDTMAQKFHSGTKYKLPFFIKHQNDDDGRIYMRKVK